MRGAGREGSELDGPCCRLRRRIYVLVQLLHEGAQLIGSDVAIAALAPRRAQLPCRLDLFADKHRLQERAGRPARWGHPRLSSRRPSSRLSWSPGARAQAQQRALAIVERVPAEYINADVGTIDWVSRSR